MTDKKNKSAKIKLAHINDTHSYFEPTSLQLTLNVEGQVLQPYVSAGGFARIASRKKELEKLAIQHDQAFICLHAGDCFQGTLYFSLFKGEANATMINALNIDAMALGNHELDMGNLPVAQFAQQINFPLLAGNWDLSNEDVSKPIRLNTNQKLVTFDPQKQAASWIMKEAQGESIAIFSLALDKMADISNPDPDTPFMNALQTARNTVKQIQKTGINKIILLSHMGYEADLEMAELVEGIGLIVGGHSHRLQGDFSSLGLKKDDVYGIEINGTRVVQSGCYALSMGHCDIEFDAEGKIIHFAGKNELLLGRRLFIDASMSEARDDDCYAVARRFIDNHPYVYVCKKDKSVQQLLIDRYTNQVRKLQREVIAYAPQPMRHVRVPDEKGPSDLAPLVAESFVYAMSQKGYDVDFAIHNAGGVRASLNAGDISVADIAGKLLPFAVPIGVYQLKGKYIAAMLEGAINNALNNGVDGTGDGSYPYTYNLSYIYDADAPKGKRIKKLQVYRIGFGWQLIEKNRYYLGTSSAYTMKGKEGYEAILNMKGEGIVTTESMADCFISLLTAYPNSIHRKDTDNGHSVWHEGC